MSVQSRGVGVLMLLALAPNVGAQFVPVVAKMRQTTEVIAKGKILRTEIREGYFYRSSDGSQLRRWTTVNGDQPQGELAWGSLQVNGGSAGKVMAYALDYKNRVAHEKPVPDGAKPLDPNGLRQFAAKPFPHDSVEGVVCMVFPVNLHLPGKDPVPVGQQCKSIDYYLVLKQDMSIPQVGSNETTHTVFELYDIQLGVEPDPALFDVKQTFAVRVALR